MKPFLLLTIFLVSFGMFAQSSSSKAAAPASSDCFKDWYSIFKERGANPVADGTHEIIITLRSGTYSECFMGKVDVVDGRLAGKLMVQKVDGSYAEFDKKVSAAYQNAEGVLQEQSREIHNGMSASVILTDGEMIRLFFYKSLAGKPQSNKKAPAPSALIKN